MYVGGGSETGAETFLSGLLPRELKAHCFHLVRSRRKKYGGKWRTVHENLMPGYVFIHTDRPEALCGELKKVPGKELLYGSDKYITALERHEAEFMEHITDKDGRIGISKVEVTEDGQIIYLSGPLASVSHMVRRVDLHKRIAEVETQFRGEKHVLYLGIEIEKESAQHEAGMREDI